MVPPASALTASVQPARRVAVPVARLVAASAPLAACVRAIPAAPAAVNEVNVMLCYSNVNLFVCAARLRLSIALIYSFDNK